MLYTARHRVLSETGEAGVPIYEASKMAGHSKLATTQLYLRTDDKKVVSAANRVSEHLQARREAAKGPRRGRLAEHTVAAGDLDSP